MSFKDQLNQDIQTVFINTDEFAEMHSINGTKIGCIVDSVDKNESMQYMQGYTVIDKSICLQASLLNVIPKTNDVILFDDNFVMVYKVSKLEGMLYLDVSQSVGKFDKDIVIYNTKLIDQGGGWEEVELDGIFISCKAYIRNQSSSEVFKLSTRLEKQQTLFKIPYVQGLKKSMILVYKDCNYNIISIDNIEENDIFTDLICEKVE